MNSLEIKVEYNKLDGIFIVLADGDIVFEAANASDAYCVKTMLEHGTLSINDLVL